MLSKRNYICKNKKPLNMWPRISHAIVMTDALNIHEGILKLKKAVLQRRAA